MNEIELPCTDCGTELVEHSVDARDLPVATNWRGQVRIAACPTCEARYYPKRALAQLTGSGPPRPRGDS